MRNVSFQRWLQISVGIFAVGLLVRLCFAWVFANAITSDHAVVCLMVKHMVEGSAHPVFYYGQPYMGTMEPILSALIARVMGLSGFSVNAGTALVGGLSLLVVFTWARRAFGMTAGLAAAGFLLIGSQHWCQFTSWAYGGYALLTLCSTVMLWQTSELMGAAGRPCSQWRRTALLGLVAGLGWWTHPLILWALVTCALLLFIRFVRRPPWLAVLTGLTGFMVGSAPLWIWNILNSWQTFWMLSGEGHPDWRVGVGRFWGYMLPALLDLDRPNRLWNLAGGILLGGLVVMAIVLAVGRWRRERESAAALSLLTIFSFVVVSMILFGQSRFALQDTARYVLALLPPIAILVGAGTASVVRRTPVGVGWIPLILLVAAQLIHFPGYRQGHLEFAAFEQEAAALGESLAKDGVEAIYTPYPVRWGNYGLNFILRERFCFSDFGRDRQRSYRETLEWSEKLGILNGHQGLNHLMRYGGGQAVERTISSRLTYQAGLVAPPAPTGPRVDWRCDALTERDPLSVEHLSDRLAHTTYRWAASDGKATVVLQLTHPIRLDAVRLFSQTRYYPGRIAMDVLPAGAVDEWISVIPDTPATRLFWSGARLYWAGAGYRMELRPTLSAPVQALRLTMTPSRNRYDIVLSELDVLAVNDAASAPEWNIAALQAYCNTQPVGRLYADRWVANQFLKDPAVCFPVSADSKLFKDRAERICDASVQPRVRDCFVIFPEESDAVVKLLTDCGAEASVEPVGPWMVVRVLSVAPAAQGNAELLWVGWTLLDGRPAETTDQVVHERGA